jgi:hypothetical protein
MERKELQTETREQLKSGTVFRSDDGRIVIIGETDTVAFEDAAGGWQVAENVIWDNVEDLTDDEILGHLLTAADFGTGINGDLLYIGPLGVAKDFMHKTDNTVTIERVDYSDKLWRVELADGNSFGVADTKEMAWRYALAAEFGPIDEEFEPFRIR